MSVPIRFTIHQNEENNINSPRYNLLEVIQYISSPENMNISISADITPFELNSIFNERIINRPAILDIKSQKYDNIINIDCKECSICYEEFNDDSSVSILKCKHTFHTGCIKKWGVRNNTCPICREEIPIIE